MLWLQYPTVYRSYYSVQILLQCTDHMLVSCSRVLVLLLSVVPVLVPVLPLFPRPHPGFTPHVPVLVPVPVPVLSHPIVCNLVIRVTLPIRNWTQGTKQVVNHYIY